LRLCDRCGAFRGLRRVYRLPHGWTPAWDAHLQRLVERAKLGLPVGIEDPAYVIPNPPDKRARKKLRPRRPRLYKFSLRSRAPHD
jgi:hypothetical protein